jgi:hypothetical protein
VIHGQHLEAAGTQQPVCAQQDLTTGRMLGQICPGLRHYDRNLTPSNFIESCLIGYVDCDPPSLGSLAFLCDRYTCDRSHANLATA